MFERSVLFCSAVLAFTLGCSETASSPNIQEASSGSSEGLISSTVSHEVPSPPGLPGPSEAQGSHGPIGHQEAAETPSTSSLIQTIYSAQQNGDLSVVGLQWTSVPGTTISFTLGQDATVDLEAHGSIHGVAGNTGNAAHCGFRFLVDNTAYGDPSWGDVITGCAVGSNYSAGWWCPWFMRRTLQLRAGTHYTTVQQTGWSGTTSGCFSTYQDYSATRLRVVVR
jgi:hypothetical protein